MQTILRPNEQRAKTAILLVKIVAFCSILGMISNGINYAVLAQLNTGESVSDENLTLTDGFATFVNVIYLIILILSGITFIQWFRRAYFNLHKMVDNLSHTEGWASGAWFVPILSLFRPFQIMKEMHVESEKLLRMQNIEPKFNYNILGWWWGLWIFTNVYDNISSRVIDSVDIDGMMVLSLTDTLSKIIEVVCAVLVISIIKNYSKYESLLKKTEEFEDFGKKEIVSDLE